MPDKLSQALWILPCCALLIAAPSLFGFLGQPFYLRVLTRILIFGLAASSLNLALGFGGMVSLGHAAFVGIGSYVVGILAFHDANDLPLLTAPLLIPGSTDPFIVWPAAIIASALAAAIIGAISLRTSGLYFIMITLAFAQMIYYAATSADQYGGDDGMRLHGRSDFPGINLNNPANFYFLVLIGFALSLTLIAFLVRSRFGVIISGIRQNQRRVRAIGIEPFPYQLVCFTISGALAGFAGILMANLDQFVSPSDLSITRSNELVAMILLGGTGTIWGPPLGAAFYIIAQLALGTLTTHWPLAFGPALILVVLFARRGLVGLFRKST